MIKDKRQQNVAEDNIEKSRETFVTSEFMNKRH